MSRKCIGLIMLTLVLGLAQASLAAWDPNTDPALIGWWKFDEGSGNTAADSSSAGNNGTINGGATWVAGFRGGAIDFDGASGYVGTGKSLLNSLADFTMAGWVKSRNATASRIGLFGQNDLVEMGFMSGSFEIWTTAAGTVNAPWGFNNLDEWHHLAAVDSGSSMILYIDGVSVRTGAGGTHTTSTFFFNIGGGGVWDGTGNWFSGQIDDVRLYKRALTAAEVKALIPPKLKASKPSPVDGATGVQLPLLIWTPGDLSVFEEVYLGTSPDLIASNRVSRQLASQKLYFHTFPPLVQGQKYYWRIDSVDAAQRVYTGDVWSFTLVPVTAWAPVPADGAKYQSVDVDLAWTAGQYAMQHEVYFSANKDDVVNGAAGASKGSVSVTTMEPGPLASGTTYYWRVDETDMTNKKNAGEVWSFTTRPEIAKTNNLVGWWKLEDENSGTAVDYSGWDRNGALLGNPKWVDGYQGGAMEFDGVDDYVDTNFNTDLASWTVCTWVTSPRAPAATSPTGPVHREANFQINWNHGTDAFRGAAALRVANTWYSAGFGSLTGNTWYHLTATYDGVALLTYVNGELAATNATPKGNPDAEAGTLKFGRHATATNFFAGTVDDVRLYDRALTQDEIKQTMRGDPLLAWDPRPMSGFTVDIRDAGTLSWSAGETAAKHDVYVGKDKAAVKNADTSSPEYAGRQAGTSYSTAGVVEFGGGAYFWRVDEVEADGTTIHKGNVWSLTVPDFLLIDDFEGYTDEITGRIFQTWIDGWGFTEPEPGNPGNGTGATVGYINPPFAERTIVKSGRQAMPFGYDNSAQPYYSETERTWASPQNWTVSGVDTLSLQVRGYPSLTSVAVTETGGKMTLAGAGADIWGNSDQFTYAFKSLSGDGTAIARVTSIGPGTNTWAKAGVMIRDSLDGGSVHAMMVMTANSDGTAGNGASFQYRATANAASGNLNSTGVVAPPYWVKVERFGDSFSGYVSPDGISWTIVGTQDVVMTDPVYVGIAVTSHAAGEQRTFQFEGIKTTGSVTGAWQGAVIDSPRYNSAQELYVAIQDSTNKITVVKNATAVNATAWTEVQIPLSSFTGVSMTKVKKMFIGVGDRTNPVADGIGMLYVDDIRIIKPVPAGQ